MDDLEAMQRSFCVEKGVEFVAAPPGWVSGFASATKGRTPLNGLRHPSEPGTTGWYLWFGEEASDAVDFYKPVHTLHLYVDFPTVGKLLGLPPGYRFLLAGEHTDIWFDRTLLAV
jgi:hypothetical protein